MKVFCVRIGDKYDERYEKYIESKLSHKYEVVWIRKPFDSRVLLQWNKMLPMSLDIDEPVVVMDIDVLLVNDYEKLFDYPIERGDFAAMPDWWDPSHRERGWTINGGFFKYYPTDCRYIYDAFMRDPQFWQQYFIKNGHTTGPVNGEQFFVEHHVRDMLNLKLMPNEWFTRWATRDTVLSYENLWADRTDEYYDNWLYFMEQKFNEATGEKGLYMGGEFHPDIKLVHFTHSMNKPHEWKDYELFSAYK